MDVVVRLHELLEKYGWFEYRLAREAGLSQTTIANLFMRNNLPTHWWRFPIFLFIRISVPFLSLLNYIFPIMEWHTHPL